MAKSPNTGSGVPEPRESSEVRERILDAFENILLASGERAATIEHIASECDLSRGGFVYHFASRRELLDAFVERLYRAGTEASGTLLLAPEGAAERYILSAGPPLSRIDKTILAATRLANDENPEVRAALLDIHRQWARVLETATGNAVLARMLLLLGDGVLFHSAMTGLPFALGSNSTRNSAREREEMAQLVRELLEARTTLQSPPRGTLG